VRLVVLGLRGNPGGSIARGGLRAGLVHACGRLPIEALNVIGSTPPPSAVLPLRSGVASGADILGQVHYWVTATFADEGTRDEFVAWLRGAAGGAGHLGEVVAAGAMRGRILLPRGSPGTWQARAEYVFASWEAFDRYVREQAPRLRADGMARFGHRGVSFAREEWEVVGAV
jgi:hypothetical protein